MTLLDSGLIATSGGCGPEAGAWAGLDAHGGTGLAESVGILTALGQQPVGLESALEQSQGARGAPGLSGAQACEGSGIGPVAHRPETAERPSFGVGDGMALSGEAAAPPAIDPGPAMTPGTERRQRGRRPSVSQWRSLILASPRRGQEACVTQASQAVERGLRLETPQIGLDQNN